MNVAVVEGAHVADRSSFTDAEWNLLLGAPMLAGMAVSAAAPSGVWGLLKESFAAGSALVDVRGDPNAPPLLKRMVEDLATAQARRAAQDAVQAHLDMHETDGIRTGAIAALAEIGRILDAKAPDEAAAFESWLVATAEKVAAATSEGGFLGFGGERVSEAEAATLDAIRAALGRPRA